MLNKNRLHGLLQISAVIAILMFLSGCQSTCGCSSSKAETLNALIVTGQTNKYHNWRVSSAVFKYLLEDTGLFKVDMAISPPQGSDMSGFKPDFSAYDVVVVDYDGDSWPKATEKAFVEYVKNGGGVVIYHSADNAFPDWPEFNEIIGLGGWGGRDEKWGPMVSWQDGMQLLDYSPGKAGAHPPRHDFQVINRRPEHPILKGLPEKWMQPKDEVYGKMHGPVKNLTILSTAYSDPAKTGTGKNEPVLFTINYGKGRVFHTTLGHVNPMAHSPEKPIESVGFIVTFQRGAEWAATGNVTQKVPADFKGGDKVEIRNLTGIKEL